MQSQYQTPSLHSSPSSSNGSTTHGSFRPRVLTADLAFKIYREIPADLDQTSNSRKSTEVAIKYGTSPKTVRDVWSRRTWSEATMALWTAEEVAERLRRRKRGPGRPVGSKDARPRMRRCFKKETTGARVEQLREVRTEVKAEQPPAPPPCAMLGGWEEGEASRTCGGEGGHWEQDGYMNAEQERGQGAEAGCLAMLNLPTWT
ncbi:hypothetical protein GUITHDRAFT_122460 [Guillardia theta CCMP2712]|uniref:Uncharacterized protein n=1 Tax=Guillardia theta (strain CCMP2712) TaxID=905079 RepID=L1I5J8_GUITC|nr:hypothetical protein GUITHDRAFT_122460 [Guillardia theta CCMP2712]EKX31342.1 hypothetical protein GUITHDRAFT_122460 [Guillardia theta CCMP2712]|eukprot:XP_005818322.1 hypothetical protein GUITHDRAFT_122460 [Guillardia theta CCMP2712]